MKITKPIICGAVLALSYIVPAHALGTPGQTPGDPSGPSHAVPAPVLGLGLPALAIIGGYVLYRRRGNKN